MSVTKIMDKITGSQRPTKPVVTEEAQEAQAMQVFQYRLASQRQSIVPGVQMRNLRAPGFDYMNWKPYGVIRYDHGLDEYERQCRGLAPYVHAVVVSGCQGAEERRWEAMTQPVDTNSRPLQTGSRAGSRDILGSRMVQSREMM